MVLKEYDFYIFYSHIGERGKEKEGGVGGCSKQVREVSDKAEKETDRKRKCVMAHKKA